METTPIESISEPVAAIVKITPIFKAFSIFTSFFIIFHGSLSVNTAQAKSLAVSITEPPPIAKIKSNLFSLIISRPSLTLSILGLGFIAESSL